MLQLHRTSAVSNCDACVLKSLDPRYSCLESEMRRTVSEVFHLNWRRTNNLARLVRV